MPVQMCWCACWLGLKLVPLDSRCALQGLRPSQHAGDPPGQVSTQPMAVCKPGCNNSMRAARSAGLRPGTCPAARAAERQCAASPSGSPMPTCARPCPHSACPRLSAPRHFPKYVPDNVDAGIDMLEVLDKVTGQEAWQDELLQRLQGWQQRHVAGPTFLISLSGRCLTSAPLPAPTLTSLMAGPAGAALLARLPGQRRRTAAHLRRAAGHGHAALPAPGRRQL